MQSQNETIVDIAALEHQARAARSAAIAELLRSLWACGRRSLRTMAETVGDSTAARSA